VLTRRRPVVLTRPPPPTATGPKVVNPVENQAKQELKSLVVTDPCPPGLNHCDPQGTCTPNILASGNHCEVGGY
jgi:hypothetical protein